MKRLLKVVLLFILLFPTLVLGKDTCNPNDIVIKNISISDTEGYAEENTPSSIDNNKIITNLKMYKVGDSIEYNIQVENTSDEDYYFNDKSIKMDTEYLEYSIVNNEELIPAKTTKTVQLKVTYTKQIPDSSYEDTNKIEINISDKPIENPETTAINTIIMIILIFIIITSYTRVVNKKNSKKSLIILLSLIGLIPLSTYAVCTVKIEVDSKVEITNKEATFLPGKDVNLKIKALDGITTTSSATPDTNIVSIKYSESEPIDTNKEEKNIVSTPESEYPIYMWIDNNTLYWWSEDTHPNLNDNSANMFRAIYNLKDITELKRIDSSTATNLTATFLDTVNLETLNGLESWDVSNVTTMQAIFGINGSTMQAGYRGHLTDISALKDWNVSNVKILSSVFQGQSSLADISNLANWNTSNVENLSSAFFNMISLSSLKGLEKWNVSNVISIQGMFYECNQLADISPLSNWNTSNVTNMSSCFYNCTGLTSLNGLENWNTSNVTYMQMMFHNCNHLEDASAITNWDVSNVENMSHMFNISNDVGEKNYSDLSVLDLSKWNMSKVKIYQWCFDSLRYVTMALTIRNPNIEDYEHMLEDVSTLGGKVTVNYTSETESIIDAIVATKSPNGNVVKGSLVQ